MRPTAKLTVATRPGTRPIPGYESGDFDSEHLALTANSTAEGVSYP